MAIPPVLAGLARVSVVVEGAGLALRAARGGYEARDAGVASVLAGAARGALAPMIDAVPALAGAFDTGPGTAGPGSAWNTSSQDAAPLPEWAQKKKAAPKSAIGKVVAELTGGDKKRRERGSKLARAQRAQEGRAPHAAPQLRAMREQTEALQQSARSRQGDEQRELMDPEVRQRPGFRQRLRELALRRRLRELTAQLAEQSAAAADPDEAARLQAMALAAAESAAAAEPLAAAEAAPRDSAIGQWVRSLFGALLSRPAARVADGLRAGESPSADPEAAVDEDALLASVEEDAGLAGCPCGGLGDDCEGGDDLEAVDVPIVYRDAIAGAPPAAPEPEPDEAGELDVFGVPVVAPALAGEPDEAGELDVFGVPALAGASDEPEPAAGESGELDVFGLPVQVEPAPEVPLAGGADDSDGSGGWARVWGEHAPTVPARRAPARPLPRGKCGATSCAVTVIR